MTFIKYLLIAIFVMFLAPLLCMMVTMVMMITGLGDAETAQMVFTTAAKYSFFSLFFENI